MKRIDQPTVPSRRIVMAGAAAMVAAVSPLLFPNPAFGADATGLLRDAFENWRSSSSETLIEMTIHRPSWERTLSMKSYTRGNDDALARFTAPAKEAGNATLKLGDRTWVFNPKVNQVVRLPASLLAQSWMGSDFSYSDLARSEDILRHYTHSVSGSDGDQIIIEALPKPGSPVVWGKQVARVRKDGILMGIAFYDQGGALVREMSTERVSTLGGRPYPAVLKMQPAGKPGEWTRVTTVDARFDLNLPGHLFTKSNLSNPRD